MGEIQRLTEEEREDMDREAFRRQQQADIEMLADPNYIAWLERQYITNFNS